MWETWGSYKNPESYKISQSNDSGLWFWLSSYKFLEASRTSPVSGLGRWWSLPLLRHQAFLILSFSKIVSCVSLSCCYFVNNLGSKAQISLSLTAARSFAQSQSVIRPVGKGTVSGIGFFPLAGLVWNVSYIPLNGHSPAHKPRQVPLCPSCKPCAPGSVLALNGTDNP